MIKFIKKFKEKILIALACSFIGIGTLLNNTIDTYASEYDTNQFSYTLTNEVVSGTTFTYDLINPITITQSGDSYSQTYVILVNFNLTPSNFTNGLSAYYYYGNTWVSFYSANVRTPGLSTQCFIISNTFNIVDSGSTITKVRVSLANATSVKNIDYINKDDIVLNQYVSSYYGTLQHQYDSLQADYTSYQNTHAYTNEQYNALMSQNATLTQQVQTLQSQYDTYVSLHTYTNEQYETLLTNYNNLQNMYSNLQSNYLVLQQQYESLALSVAPFTSSKWNNRTGSLNGVTYDLQNNYRDSLVSFEKTYIYISPRDLDVFENHSTGSNTFVLTAYCNQHIILNGFNVIANLSHLDEESFQINFYLDNSLVYSTIDFDNDMGENDSNTISVDRFLEFNQITVTVIVNYDNLYNSNGYFNAVVGTWQDGYDYAVGKLMPEINRLEDELQQSNSQQQVKYNEGYNKGISDSNSQPLYGMVIRIL